MTALFCISGDFEGTRRKWRKPSASGGVSLHRMPRNQRNWTDCVNVMPQEHTVTILRDTVTTAWSADDIGFLILNISCWSDILVLYVFSSTFPVLACYSHQPVITLERKQIWRGIFHREAARLFKLKFSRNLPVRHHSGAFSALLWVRHLFCHIFWRGMKVYALWILWLFWW